MFPSGPPRQSFAYTQAFGFGSRDNGNLLPERAESQLERSVRRILSLFMDRSPSIIAFSCRMPVWTVWTGILNWDIVDLLPVGSMMPAIW